MSIYLWLSKGRIFDSCRYADFDASRFFFLKHLLSAGMLSPPSDPFVTNVEREIIILVSVLVAWGLVHGFYRTGSYFMLSIFTDGQA
jgi:hypothetical protein